MAKVIIEGTVVNVYEKLDKKKDKKVKWATLVQEGEEGVVNVKGVNGEAEIGAKVALVARVYPWAPGNNDANVTYVNVE